MPYSKLGSPVNNGRWRTKVAYSKDKGRVLL